MTMWRAVPDLDTGDSFGDAYDIIKDNLNWLADKLGVSVGDTALFVAGRLLVANADGDIEELTLGPNDIVTGNTNDDGGLRVLRSTGATQGDVLTPSSGGLSWAAPGGNAALTALRYAAAMRR